MTTFRNINISEHAGVDHIIVDLNGDLGYIEAYNELLEWIGGAWLVIDCQTEAEDSLEQLLDSFQQCDEIIDYDKEEPECGYTRYLVTIAE
ncbi:hypothetical protein [Vibrio phage YC]|uniref:Uncharacterized protein n=1 Tax=Vibrio phage YC TaxID=2267403 RepID=A0A384ZS71_9CAUD|nr:hypothetical protein HWB64_gp095 [Vibrio phage YC]AXC34464.1 hypothetical protein [Vibrio phage YC]